MKRLATLALTSALAIGGLGEANGRGSPHEARSTQGDAGDPCGWKNGSLPEPAQTRACLAERYKAAHPKAQPSNSTLPPAPDSH
ncbi:MAG TPA: hypothetical protein VMU37_01075 [Caulobacteraceae bacterium]|nr:hypothetical protein [Caulobacteraceae bacterium]